MDSYKRLEISQPLRVPNHLLLIKETFRKTESRGCLSGKPTTELKAQNFHFHPQTSSKRERIWSLTTIAQGQYINQIYHPPISKSQRLQRTFELMRNIDLGRKDIDKTCKHCPFHHNFGLNIFYLDSLMLYFVINCEYLNWFPELSAALTN